MSLVLVISGLRCKQYTAAHNFYQVASIKWRPWHFYWRKQQNVVFIKSMGMMSALLLAFWLAFSSALLDAVEHSKSMQETLNSYSACHDNWCTATLWNRIMTVQCEEMGEVGSARYEPALLPPCPSIRALSYSNCERSTHSNIRAWQFKC